MKPLCLLLCVFINLSLLAQRKISGMAQGQDKKALVAVNILAYQLTDTDSVLSAFAITNTKGQFSMTVEGSSVLLLKASALGYADEFLKITTSDSSLTYTFTLTTQALQLREVVVKGPPVRANNDTTTYRAKDFVDGTERNVEELLSKLPGVRVAENGKITVHGKAVDKVMIEGEDLFSKNYQIITRSLSAGVLDKVEAIDNYSENALLKGIEKSNKMVLNLTVKNDLKIKPFGSVGGDVGYKNRYDIHTTVLTLFGKLKGGLVGNVNNIGYNPVEASEYDLAAAADDTKGFGRTQSGLLTAIPMVQVPNIEARRVSFNQAKLLGTTASYKINNKLKIKGFTYIYGDKVALNFKNTTQFFVAGTNVQYKDSSVQSRTPFLWANQLKAEYSLNAKVNFKYTFNHKKTDVESHSFLDTQNAQLSEIVPTNAHDNINSFNHSLNGVKRLDDKNAVIADVSLSWADVSRNTFMQSRRYAQYFKINHSFTDFYQSVLGNQQELKSNLVWRNVNRLGNLKVGFGYLNSQDVLQTNLQLRSKTQTYNFLNNDFKNNFDYKNEIGLFDVQQSITYKKINFNIGGTAQMIRTQLHDFIASQNNFEKYKLLIQPTLGASVRLSNSQRLMFLYYNQQQLPVFKQFADNYMQSNYRSFDRSMPTFYVTQNNTCLLSYNNTDWTRLYAVNLSLSFNQRYFVDTYEFVFSNLLGFSTQKPIEATLNQLSANWELDRLIDPISVKIRLEGYVSQNETLNRVNGNNTMNYMQMFDNKLYAISAFDGPFNFQASTRLSISRVLSRLDYTQLSQTTLVIPELIVRLKPIKNLTLKLTGQQINWRNENSQNSTNLLDFMCFYTPQSQWTFSFHGNNLLNSTAIYYTDISNYSISQNSYSLQPLMLLAAVSKSF